MGVLTTSPRFVPAVTGVTDSFNRADSTTTLGTADTGQTWTALSGTWGITSNQAYSVSPADGNLAVVDVGSPDQVITATLTFSGSGPYPGIVARCTDANNYYLAQGYGDIQIRKCVAGAFSTIGATFTFNSGDVMEFSAIGTALKLKRNGVEVLSITDSSLTTGNLVGLRHGQTGACTIRFDDFSAVV